MLPFDACNRPIVSGAWGELFGAVVFLIQVPGEAQAPLRPSKSYSAISTPGTLAIIKSEAGILRIFMHPHYSMLL